MANKILKTLNFGGTDVYDLAPNWKNVEDRPFGYETPTGGDTLTWDGNTSGLEGVMGILYRVHEATPTVKEGTVEINSSGTVTSTPFTVEDKNEGVQYLVANNVAMAVIVPTDGITVDGLKFNKAGIYLRKSGNEYVSSLTIKDCEDFKGVKTLDYKYLPKSLRFGSDGVKTDEILPLTTEFVTFDDDGDGVDDLFALQNMLQGIEDGKTYTVKYNGVDYKCVAQYIDMEGLVMYVLGNFDLSMGTGDTGEPFVISSFTTQEDVESFGAGVMIRPLDGSIPTSLAISYETENITPIKTKYLPEHLQFGVEEGSGGATEILPPTEFVTGDDSGQEWYCFNAITGIEIGQTYTVNFNGVDYKCTAIEESQILGIPLPFLGNIDSLMGTGDTGEPFVMWIIPAEMVSQAEVGAILMSIDVVASITISITGGSQTIKKLDNKYLDLDWIPKTKKGMAEVFSETLDFTSNSSTTFNEIKFEIIGGETYQVDWDGTIYNCVGIVDGVGHYRLGNESLAFYGDKGEDTGEPFLFEYMMMQGLLYMTFRIKSTSSSQVWVNVIGPKLEATPMPSIFAPETFDKVRTKALEMYDVDYNRHTVYFGINGPMYLQKNNEAVRQVATVTDASYPVFTYDSNGGLTCNFTYTECSTAYYNGTKPFYLVEKIANAKRYYLIDKITSQSNQYTYETTIDGHKLTITYASNGTLTFNIA